MIRTKTRQVDNTSTVAGATLDDALATVAAIAGGLTPADRDKLDSVQTGATANSTDSALRARASHTGTQAISTVTGLQTALDAKAPLASPTFTGTVTGITKAMVGLGNVANTADADKPVSTATQTALNLKMTTTNPVVTAGTVQEDVYAVVDAAGVPISPANGSIQTWTLGANRTPTKGTWAVGQGILLMVDDGTAFTITWASLPVTWLTSDGNPPTLKTTGYTAIVLWQVGSTIYGK